MDENEIKGLMELFFRTSFPYYDNWLEVKVCQFFVYSLLVYYQRDPNEAVSLRFMI